MFAAAPAAAETSIRGGPLLRFRGQSRVMRTLVRLGERHAEEYRRLRSESLSEAPLSFGASPKTDFSATLDGVREQLRREATILIGAFEDEVLAGCVGLLIPRHAKARHKLHLWGMYVSRPFRGHGIGRELLQAAIDQARAMPTVEWIELGVTSESAAAKELYSRAGFEMWGREADALRDADRSVDEYRMALRLR